MAVSVIWNTSRYEAEKSLHAQFTYMKLASTFFLWLAYMFIISAAAKYDKKKKGKNLPDKQYLLKQLAWSLQHHCELELDLVFHWALNNMSARTLHVVYTSTLGFLC